MLGSDPSVIYESTTSGRTQVARGPGLFEKNRVRAGLRGPSAHPHLGKEEVGGKVIRDPALWAAWESQGPLSEPPDFERNLRLLEAMYQYARQLGRFPPTDLLAGLENKVRVARVVNVCSPARKDRSGT